MKRRAPVSGTDMPGENSGLETGKTGFWESWGKEKTFHPGVSACAREGRSSDTWTVIQHIYTLEGVTHLLKHAAALPVTYCMYSGGPGSDQQLTFTTVQGPAPEIPQLPPSTAE